MTKGLTYCVNRYGKVITEEVCLKWIIVIVWYSVCKSALKHFNLLTLFELNRDTSSNGMNVNVEFEFC